MEEVICSKEGATNANIQEPICWETLKNTSKHKENEYSLPLLSNGKIFIKTYIGPACKTCKQVNKNGKWNQ